MNFLKRVWNYFSLMKHVTVTCRRLTTAMWGAAEIPQPAVTIFGSAKLPEDSQHSRDAYSIAKRLSGRGYTVITGGGPGIMAAANRGALDGIPDREKNGFSIAAPASIGIGLKGLNVRELKNKYMQRYIETDHFFTRKWLLTMNSVGFVVFPGGYGTLDELFEILVLMQCRRMRQLPIILFDSGYWHGLIEFVTGVLLKNGMISADDLSLVTAVTDSVDETVYLIAHYSREKSPIGGDYSDEMRAPSSSALKIAWEKLKPASERLKKIRNFLKKRNRE